VRGRALREDLEESQKVAERATALTRQLLPVGRKQAVQPVVLDLNWVVTGTEKMLRRVIGEDLTLVTELAPDLKAVRADRGQLEQVIVNLAVNARDAMPQGGHVTIRTANVELSEANRRDRPDVARGTYGWLSARDRA